MKKSLFAFVVLFFSLILINKVNAQCNFIADDCAPSLTPFFSDCQSRRALVEEGDTVEFRVTFYAGNTYRIQACPGLVLDYIHWSVWDFEKHELFANSKHSNINQWDFDFAGTQDCLLKACLPKGSELGCLVMLVGFKE